MQPRPLIWWNPCHQNQYGLFQADSLQTRFKSLSLHKRHSYTLYTIFFVITNILWRIVVYKNGKFISFWEAVVGAGILCASCGRVLRRSSRESQAPHPRQRSREWPQCMQTIMSLSHIFCYMWCTCVVCNLVISCFQFRHSEILHMWERRSVGVSECRSVQVSMCRCVLDHIDTQFTHHQISKTLSTTTTSLELHRYSNLMHSFPHAYLLSRLSSWGRYLLRYIFSSVFFICILILYA